jgi:hypothetical protein
MSVLYMDHLTVAGGQQTAGPSQQSTLRQPDQWLGSTAPAATTAAPLQVCMVQSTLQVRDTAI